MQGRRTTVQHKALVIKRSSFGESDRMITLLSAEAGRQVVVARGARNITSSRIASLEPGTFITAHLVQTKSLPILSQAVIINQLPLIDISIGRLRAISQWLELLDVLFVEEAMDDSLFELVLQGRTLVTNPNTSLETMRKHLLLLIETLGFTDDTPNYEQSISDLISTIADKPLHSYDYLTVR